MPDGTDPLLQKQAVEILDRHLQATAGAKDQRLKDVVMSLKFDEGKFRSALIEQEIDPTELERQLRENIEHMDEASDEEFHQRYGWAVYQAMQDQGVDLEQVLVLLYGESEHLVPRPVKGDVRLTVGLRFLNEDWEG